MDFIIAANRIYAEDTDGNLLAEVDFPAVSPDTVNISHTFVDDSLRGQGIAGQLLAATAKTIRGQGKKVRPTCSYAVKWFEKHKEEQDLLEEESDGTV